MMFSLSKGLVAGLVADVRGLRSVDLHLRAWQRPSDGAAPDLLPEPAGTMSYSRHSQPYTSTLDKIHLKGLQFHGYHGVLPEERTLGQKFLVDASLFLCLKKAGATDSMEHSVDYADVYTQIKEIMEGPPLSLLEAVADRICSAVLKKHHLVHGLRVHVCKPHVAVSGPVQSLGVDITRWRLVVEAAQQCGLRYDPTDPIKFT